MANTIDWGKATQNNTNGFGKYQNTINAGDIYEDSWAGETALIGTSAAFSYSKSSYHQDEADPTPTITGTTGGTFSATPSGLSINSSTGTIDLSASTIQPYTITYTVSGVSANFSLSVTASPFISNTFSMQFDAASSQYINVGTSTDLEISGNLTLSAWVYLNTGSAYQGIISKRDSGGTNYQLYTDNSATPKLRFFDGSTPASSTGNVSLNAWHHIAITIDSGVSNGSIFYIDGVNSGTATFTITLNDANLLLGAIDTGAVGSFLNGKLDEVAIWNAALGETAIQEIYNATANNTGKALDLSTDYNNYTSSSNLQYWNRLGD